MKRVLGGGRRTNGRRGTVYYGGKLGRLRGNATELL